MTNELDSYSAIAIMIVGILGLFWTPLLLVAWVGAFVWATVFLM